MERWAQDPSTGLCVTQVFMDSVMVQVLITMVANSGLWFRHLPSDFVPIVLITIQELRVLTNIKSVEFIYMMTSILL